MATGLNERQTLMLETLRRLPASWRHQRRAYAPIRWEVLDSYDARTWKALFDRGLLRFKRIGDLPFFEVVGQRPGRP